MFNLKSKNSRENILQLSVSVYFSILILSTALYAVFFFHTRIYLLFGLELFYLVIHIIWGARAIKDRYDKVMELIPYYFMFISIYLFPFALYLWKLGIYTGVLWYALIPFGAKLHVTNGNMKGWMLFSVTLVAAIITLQYFVEFDHALNNRQVIFFNSFNTVLCFAYMYVCLYCNTKLNHAESEPQQLQLQEIPPETISEAIPEATPESEPEPAPAVDGKQSEQFTALFKDISDYFKKHKPYLNADFDASKLAHDLGSNTSYITKAIKYNTDNNFNWFVNSYRIEYIQKLFENEKYSAYTIDHLRVKAGFKNQSTFNESFRKQTGKTPSEYLESLANRNV